MSQNKLIHDNCDSYKNSSLSELFLPYMYLMVLFLSSRTSTWVQIKSFCSVTNLRYLKTAFTSNHSQTDPVGDLQSSHYVLQKEARTGHWLTHRIQIHILLVQVPLEPDLETKIKVQVVYQRGDLQKKNICKGVRM